MPNDEIAEIRKIRHQISEECGHDIHKVAAYYRRVEEKLKKSGAFRFEEPSSELQNAAAAGDAGEAE